MRRIIRGIAKFLRFSAWYHVSGVYYTKEHGTSYISMKCKITPWLHEETYEELSRYLLSKAQGDPHSVSIVSIVKLGV